MNDAPASEPAWHPDPWGKAELRWHDGTRWTEHVHGAAAAEAEPAAASPATVAAPAAASAAPHLVSAAPPPSLPSGPVHATTSGKAIAALVTGLIGIPIVPLVLGIMALRQIGRSAGALTGRWMAIVGIVFASLQLLVIPILLAVAIPTFLAQKDAAVKTMATANAKQVVNAVEQCAAGNTDGTYTGCDAAGIARVQPGIQQVLSASCAAAAPGKVCVELAADMRGYTVRATTVDTPASTFTQQMGSDGTLTKSCSGPACPTGTW